MENVFQKLLDDDEQVVKVIKPNKLKFYISWFFMSSFTLLWFVIVATCAILFDGMIDKVYAVIPVVAFVLIEFFILIFAQLYYNNYYFAYTNKRIIIRSGVFGVDFRSLDMGMIGAIDVHVSLIDKILGKDTGTVCFGSTASPMIGTQSASYYKFAHIEKPYESCKEYKQAIDAYKNNQCKSNEVK